MSRTGPWSVKGIEQRARDAARQAARDEGLTLGAYMNRLILQEQEAQASPEPLGMLDAFGDKPLERSTPVQAHANTALDRITRRIESIEARSTLAITGIDQSVLGLVARLENNEHSLQAHNAHIDGVVEDLRQTHAILTDKVAQLESDDAPQRNLEAMKTLEHALGQLASHVYDENKLAQSESEAIKARMEQGLSLNEDRIDTMEAKVQRTLEDATRRFEQTISAAEQARGTADGAIVERMKSLEAGIAEKLAVMETADERLATMESNVSGALDTMGSTLFQVQERLNRAEATTDQALKSLESTFHSLDKRIDIVAAQANPEAANALRRHFEEKFDGLAEDLRTAIASTRTDFANRIDQVAVQGDAESAARLDASISAINDRLDTVELDSAASGMTAAREEVARLSQGLETRLDEMEARDASMAERVGTEMGRLAEQLDNRVTQSEQRNAVAIEQVGEQVSTMSQRIQSRQDEALKTFSDKLEQARKQADTRLSDAIGNVSDRLEEIQQQSSEQISPVQRAIASLARRIESMEDFAAPPFFEPSRHGAETAAPPPPFCVDEQETSDAPPAQSEESDLPSSLVTAEPPALETPSADTTNTSFLETLPDFAADAAKSLDIDPPPFDQAPNIGDANNDIETPPAHHSALYEEATEPSALLSPSADDMDSPLSDELWDTELLQEPDVAPETFATDPLSDLVEWTAERDNDGRSEARDSDVFDALDVANQLIDTPTDAAEGTASRFVPMDASGNVQPLEEAVADPDFEAHSNTPFQTFDDEETPSPETQDDPHTHTIAQQPHSEGEDTTEDYITRARRAAQAAADDAAGAKGRRRFKRSKSSATTRTGTGQLSRVAMSAVIGVSAVGTASYLYMNGRNGPDIVAVTTPSFSQPRAASQPAAFANANAPTPLDEPTSPTPTPSSPEEPSVATITAETAAPPLSAALPTTTPVINTLSSPRLPLPAGPIAANFTLVQAAEAGDPVAAYIVGEEHLTRNEIASGVALIRRAANAGLPVAQYALSELHNSGLGLARDPEAARRWAERAAEGGNVKAMHDLAVFMANGQGGPRTYTGAVEWFRKAAEFGLPDSQYNLAILYDEGLGISPDVAEALFWLELVAATGDPGANQMAQEVRTRVSLELAQSAQNRAANWQPAAKDGPANGLFGEGAWAASPPGQVHDIQLALNALGYEAGTPDGAFGRTTSAAIRAFENDQGLTLTGRITDALVLTLNRAIEPLRQ